MRKLLLPLGWLYGLVMEIRNLLFEMGVLPSRSFQMPIICVGNISVGGTGKTPHTEYIVNLFRQTKRVAILSRGYKRKSKGYILADEHSTAEQIGDEPYQMKQKFADVCVAVDADRCEGIENLMQIDPPLDLIVLDDAYQHRYVKAGMNILLVDYNRLIYQDHMLPAGNLREPVHGSQRADIIIITKCPMFITPTEQRGIEKSLRLAPWQKIFYTNYTYAHTLNDYKEYKVLLVTGIGNPKQMESDLREFLDITPLHFSDHHKFTAKDIELIKTTYKTMPGEKKIIMTTEKDATRLPNLGLPLCVLPIEVTFVNKDENIFNKIVTDYVEKNARIISQ